MLPTVQSAAAFGEQFTILLNQIVEVLASPEGTNWFLKVLSALLILVVGRWIAKAILRILRLGLEKTPLDATLRTFFLRLAGILMMVVVFLSALDALGVQTTSLVAILGAAGLAIGLALQNSLSNFAAGIMLILFRPFQVGDAIEAGGIAGTVEEISIFTTRLRTGDNRLIIVPNSTFTTQSVTNANAKPTRRIDLTIGISYNDNIKTAKEIILRVLAAEPRILPEPTPVVAVANLGDNSVDLIIRPWVRTPDYWAVRFHLLETLKTELEAGGCSIPYPQHDVHVFHSAAGQ